VNEFGEGMQAKLEHDFRPVRFNRSDGNSQLAAISLFAFPPPKVELFQLRGALAGLENALLDPIPPWS